MSARTSGRQHRPVNYSEKQAGGGSAPAWTLQLTGVDGAQDKENARSGGAAPAGRKSGGAGQQKAPAVAQKGRNAGLERLPIEDGKAGRAGGSGKGRSSGAAVAPPAAAGKQVLPGVFVKGADPAAPAAKSGSGGKGAGASAVPAVKSGSGCKGVQQASKPAAAAPAATKSGSAGKKAAAQPAGQPVSAEAPVPAAKSGSGGKRKAASVAAPAEEAGPSDSRQAAKSAPAAVGGRDAKRQKPAVAAPQLAAQERHGAVQAAPAGAPAAAPAAEQGDMPAPLVMPGSEAEALLEEYSANFHALQADYDKLQALYEDLKAAKIDEEVQQLLEQQNRYVSEHGQKAAALVEHYKKEAAHHAAVAAQVGGDALVEQCHRVQADLMNCQQALLDKEAESLEKEKRLAEMAARLAFLERYARVYDSCDKCVQTDGQAGEDVSQQFPSLQSSGVEMLQAHALVPEGAGGGSIYRRPRAPPGPPVPDTSYTLPAGTPLVATAAAAAAAAARSPLAAAAAGNASAGAPVSGSDMELTGPAATQQQQPQAGRQEQQQTAVQQCDQGLQTEPEQQRVQQGPAQQAQRRQSLQPVAGRMAHAAAGPVPRPASAESQVQLGPRQQQQQRRASMVPAPSAAAAAVAAAGASRRLSAPPAPVDRELHFTSASTAERQGPAALAAVPEEAPLAAEGQVNGLQQQDQQQHQPAAQGAAGVESPPFEFPQMPEPAASELTAPAAAAAGRSGAPTPGSIPAPPRHLAITALTGLTATPVKGGIFQYHDPRSGFTFELGPAPPDSADLGDEGPRMRYRPVQLGAAAALLPPHFHDEISFAESQKQNFFQQLMHSLHQRR
ncbi:hypothetical protein ABPG75_004852 [Micractinium tetrahymenae]